MRKGVGDGDGVLKGLAGEVAILLAVLEEALLSSKRLLKPLLTPLLVKGDLGDGNALLVQVEDVLLAAGLAAELDDAGDGGLVALEPNGHLVHVADDALERVEGEDEATVAGQEDIVPDGVSLRLLVLLALLQLLLGHAGALGEDPQLHRHAGRLVAVEKLGEDCLVALVVAGNEGPLADPHAEAEAGEQQEALLNDSADDAEGAAADALAVDSDPVVGEVVREDERRLVHLRVAGEADLEAEHSLHVEDEAGEP